MADQRATRWCDTRPKAYDKAYSKGLESTLMRNDLKVLFESALVRYVSNTRFTSSTPSSVLPPLFGLVVRELRFSCGHVSWQPAYQNKIRNEQDLIEIS